ncbi:hypothetical protein F4Y59_11625 [Candidatus Poribacteria bacterium]|nr:hypothetical protein [Candidatus Poribacteria bacterium]MYK17909.1 hypothetical protein [Candidatus Poribacteria bacterium]
MKQYNLTICSETALQKHKSYLCCLPIFTLLFAFVSVFAFAQGTPRLNSLFPAGGQLGTTVEIAIQGSDLEDAHTLIIEGDPGITAQLHAGGGEVDDTHKPVFEANCGQCHELRSPNNRSMTPAQWQATVQRMVTEKGAEIGTEAQTQIVAYLTSAARANAGLTAELTIAPDAPVGLREVRIVGKHGTSTAWPFEVTQIPDVVETESNNTPEAATTIELPSLINGVINPGGDADYYVFEGMQGQRCIFSVKAYRLNNISQQFFNPTIAIFDAKGVEIARSNGFYSLDPLLDVTLPADGPYLLRIRDLLYRGNPDSVYRLTSGVLPYNTYLFPAGGTVPGAERRLEENAEMFYGPPTPPEPNIIQCVVGGENLSETDWQIEVTADEQPGLKQVRTPYGIFPFIVNTHSEVVEEQIESEFTVDEFAVQAGTTQSNESQILFETKCSACHELRSPSNRALSTEEWERTITRMANKENADITPTERDRIIAFVAQEAQRLGELIARQLEHAQQITTPGAVSGRISEPGEIDYYRFTISEGTSLGPWWVIFPFDNINETGFDTVYPPETEIDLDKEYIGKDGRKIGWYKTDRRGENVFSNVPEDDVTGYALTYLESDRDQNYLLSLGSDDTIKIWVNDELVFSKYVHRPLRRADDVIQLPVSKGRNKILVKVTNGYGPWGFFADIGGYSLTASAELLNSPLSPSLTLLDSEGQVLANNAGIGGRRNAIIDYSFNQPGVYAVRIEDIAGNGGAGYVYHLDVRPTTPDFAISVTPDNPNVGRGGTVLLEVTLQRRVGFTEPIRLSVENLPPGITASEGAILSSTGVTQGYITLTAAPDAELTHRVVQVVGSVTTTAGNEYQRAAMPVEIYRIQNNDQTVQRKNVVVSITETAPIILSTMLGKDGNSEVSTEPLEVVVTPDGTIDITVKVTRQRGNRQNLNLTAVGLPIGVRLQRRTTVLRRNQTEATLTLVPNIITTGTGGNQLRRNPFAGTQQTLPYTIVINAAVGQRRVASSPGIKLWLGNPSNTSQEAPLGGN